MSDYLSAETLEALLYAHAQPNGLDRYEFLILGKGWQKAAGGSPKFLGLNVVVVSDVFEDTRIRLMRGAANRFEHEDVSLAPIQVRGIIRLLRSGAVRVLPSAASHQYWQLAKLAFVDEETRDQFADYVQAAHGRVEIDTATTVRKRDGEFEVINALATSPGYGKDVASLLHTLYGVPVDTGEITAQAARYRRLADELDRRIRPGG